MAMGSFQAGKSIIIICLFLSNDRYSLFNQFLLSNSIFHFMFSSSSSSRWPSEIVQDEFAGWNLRVAPLREIYKMVGDNWEVYADEQSKRFFYHNRMRNESYYEKPEEIGEDFIEDWAAYEMLMSQGGSNSNADGHRLAIEAEGGEHDSALVLGLRPKENDVAEEIIGEYGKYWDDNSEAFYYFHSVSGHSTFERPVNFTTMNDPFEGLRDEEDGDGYE
jgi:hypothetical protein